MTTSTQTQLRRGTSSQCAAMTPAVGEPIVDTTNNRINIGNGSTAGGIPLLNYTDQQKQKFVYPTVGGTGNAITLTNVVPLTAYGNATLQIFKATANQTGACTANSDSLGTRNIKLMLDGSLQDPPSGSIVTGGIYGLYDDGTQFQLKMRGEATITPPSLIQTPLAVGSIILACYSGGSSLGAGATTAAANLRPAYMTTTQWGASFGYGSKGTGLNGIDSGDTLAGTWQALQAIPGGGSTIDHVSGANVGLFQRTA